MKKQIPGATFDKVVESGFKALKDASINLKIANIAMRALLETFKDRQRIIDEINNNDGDE